MPETSSADHDSSDRIEQALSESQRLEREELHADLDRQRAADERMVNALTDKQA